ncbi:MAG: DUF2764 domain-containing protein [Clostridium sp.]|nr:DUF2764 domain-containing protein [Clostridium sp.]
MGNYYYLMAGLPDLSLDDSKSAPSMLSLKEELTGSLSASDSKLLYVFFLKYDCRNLVRLLENPEAEVDPRGNFTEEQYRDLIISAREMNFNVHRFPPFMSEFARNYAYNKDSEGYFASDAMELAYYEYAMRISNRMMARWYELNFHVASILTALIARKNGWNVSAYVKGRGEVCDMIRENNTRDFDLMHEVDYMADLMQIVDCENPVEKEQRIDAFKWAWLDEQTFFDSFSIESLFAYLVKIEMMERWSHLDVETGRATFRRIIDNLRGEARVPDEFKK